jgi:hypothetical protein
MATNEPGQAFRTPGHFRRVSLTQSARGKRNHPAQQRGEPDPVSKPLCRIVLALLLSVLVVSCRDRITGEGRIWAN